MTTEDFLDIAPYDNDMFHPKIASLIKEPGFRNVLTAIMPGLDYQAFTKNLLKIENRDDFQKIIMLPFLEQLEKGTTAGVTMSGVENYDRNCS